MPVAGPASSTQTVTSAVLAQPIGEHAAGRARADDHIVESVHTQPLAIDPSHGYSPPRQPGEATCPRRSLFELWEAHCRHEFETRDVDATMATMVAEPYVNHVPTMTGGVGHDAQGLLQVPFHRRHPPDTELMPVFRTVGPDQIVDELIFGFTHTSEIDGCCRAFRLPAGRSRFRWSPSCCSSATRSRMSTSTGTRRRCWCRSACSIRTACRSPAERLAKVVVHGAAEQRVDDRWSTSADKPIWQRGKRRI